MLEFLINRTWAIELPLVHFSIEVIVVKYLELVSAVERKRTSINQPRSRKYKSQFVVCNQDGKTAM